MKKLIALAAAAMMLLSLFTACGKEPAANNDNDTEKTTTFTVGFDAEFPPYGYQDENGELCSNCSTILSSMNRKEYAMNPYIYLGGAILAEVIGTTLMKFSEGFTRLWPSVGTIICYCASVWLLAQTLAYIPTGIAYAIWSGVGIVLISLLSWGFFGQRLDLPAIIGMMLICAGVLVINLLSRSAPH